MQESLRAAIDGFLSSVWTALPGQVVSVDFTKMTVVVQPTIKMLVRDSSGKQNWQSLPQLPDVPLLFPAAGGFALTLPVAPGDEVLVVFASRCIDLWWQNSGVQIQGEARKHDLSDGFAILSPRSVPKVIANISPSNARLTKEDGSAYLELTPAGIVNIVAPGGVNIQGNLAVTGTIGATQEITAKGTHTVSAHIHGGVQTGSGNTGTPTG